MNTAPPDPYTVLGVPHTATTAEIAHAYRTQLRAHHPDTRQHDEQASGSADAQLRRILAAHALLRDLQRRAVHDRLHPALAGSPSATPGRNVRRTPEQRPRPPIQASPVYWRPPR